MLDQKISPMLAYTADPFDSPRYLYEIKWDGTRCILFVEKNRVRLQNRRLADITYRYPEFSDCYKVIKAKQAILDGELIALTEGKSDFGKLQRREQVSDVLKAELYAQQMPATFMAFDVLYANGEDHTQTPLARRKDILHKLLGSSPYLAESRYIEEKGKSFFDQTMAYGLEGVMGKRLDSPYLIGKRSRYWLKVKPKHSAICHIIGYTQGRGGRQRFFGALAVATREEERWKYRGRVGSGFTQEAMKSILNRLMNLKVVSPVVRPSQENKAIQWVRPDLKCEVVFNEITSGGHFRGPVFRRMVN